jgi:hypothetical protein
MEGLFPCLPLNPLHPRADGDAVVAGFKKEDPFSFSSVPGGVERHEERRDGAQFFVFFGPGLGL